MTHRTEQTTLTADMTSSSAPATRSPEENMSAEAALAHYQATGNSPLPKGQTHLFVFGSAASR
jgi:hypothetical protein